VDNKDICSLYKEEEINWNNRRRKVCSYYNLDIQGLCNHPDRKTCIVFIRKQGINDPVIQGFIEDLELVMIKRRNDER